MNGSLPLLDQLTISEVFNSGKRISRNVKLDFIMMNWKQLNVKRALSIIIAQQKTVNIL